MKEPYPLKYRLTSSTVDLTTEDKEPIKKGSVNKILEGDQHLDNVCNEELRRKYEDVSLPLTIQDYEAKKINAVITIQRWEHSRQRAKLHEDIFNRPPLFFKYDPSLKIKNVRFRDIAINLANQHLIINNKVYHWTNISNFQQILKSGSFFGNQILKAYRIKFSKNALTSADIRNGDGKVICLSPFLVCPTALLESAISVDEKLRENLIRLTLDLRKVDIQGKYNQFFKIHDLEAPRFNIENKITRDLSINFHKFKNYFHINFKFENKK